MLKTKLTLVTTFLCYFTLLAQTQSNDGWVFKNEKGGVKVFYRKTSDIYELKLVTSIKSSLTGLMLLLSEVENYPKWGYKVAESRTLQKVSDQEVIYYSKLDFPWPLDDRDLIMYNRMEQDPVTRKVVATSIAKPDYVAKTPGVVRVETAKTVWTIVPGDGGWLYVEYYIYSNPAGNLPEWLVNMAIDVGPRETIKNIRKFVADPRYQTAKLAHIRE